jgi:hypothetical protein
MSVDVRVALLTTETPHHLFFARQLAEAVPSLRIVLETVSPEPPFETAHPFETRRDEYERDVLLDGFRGMFDELAPTTRYASINEAAPQLVDDRPDALLVFGTTILEQPLIGAAASCLNLHGGNPEEYRGLDTHLWAIYHRDFENLVTTLHHVDEALDTGDVVALEPIPLEPGMKLYQLRAANTRICVSMSLGALEALEGGMVSRRAQHKRGRYYSFMPAVLKDRCVSQFEDYTSRL